LRLGVVVNKRLYAHSMPDIVEFWRPIEEIAEMSVEQREKVKEAYIWGRKLWGFDYVSGTRTRPFTQKEVEEFLEKVHVQGLVVGHTPMSCPDPYYAFEGKVINIDLHGVPGSKAFIEFYDPAEDDKVPAPFVGARYIAPDAPKRLARLEETPPEEPKPLPLDLERPKEPSGAPAPASKPADWDENEERSISAEVTSSGDIVIL
jgi:hypothetical protein